MARLPRDHSFPSGCVFSVWHVLCKLSGHTGSLLFKTTNTHGKRVASCIIGQLAVSREKCLQRAWEASPGTHMFARHPHGKQQEPPLNAGVRKGFSSNLGKPLGWWLIQKAVVLEGCSFWNTRAGPCLVWDGHRLFSLLLHSRSRTDPGILRGPGPDSGSKCLKPEPKGQL